MKWLALILFLSITASAEESLLEHCQKIVAMAQQAQDEFARVVEPYKALIKANKEEAAAIVSRDQPVLEAAIENAYLNMPNLVNYVAAVKALSPNSQLRRVALSIFYQNQSQGLASVREALRNQSIGYGVIMQETGVGLYKTYNVHGLELELGAKAFVYFIDDQPNLIISTTAHSTGPRDQTMEEGLKIVNLETQQEILSLSKPLPGWGGPTRKQALKEPFSPYENEIGSLMSLAAKYPELEACRDYVHNSLPLRH